MPAYWLVGLPLSLYLGFRLDMKVEGLWWGSVLSLTLLAIFNTFGTIRYVAAK